MKILFYCQHVLGIGHFFRSMEIAGALHKHSVLFAGGGDALAGFTSPGHVAVLSLPALMMDPEFKSLQTREDSVEKIKEARKSILLKAFASFDPDLILTELFPFGRRQFRFELMPLLHAARERSRPVRVVCSLRDILVEKPEKPNYESEVVEALNRYYDLLLVHSDPNLIRLDETFGLSRNIRIPTEYTGFVARPSVARNTSGLKRVIVASSGGGRVGVDLLSAAIKAVRGIELQDLEFRVFIGPFMEEDDRTLLVNLASRDARIRLLPFSPDFLSELAAADLSISMAGYNTCMDILSAGVPALVYPFAQNREQRMRAAKLEKSGALKVLSSLNTDLLRSEIENLLRNPSASSFAEINLSGSANTSRLIENLYTSN
ncbi:MAG: glycosyltransferase family protein [Syntrophobacteraceae bacterium]